MFDEDFRLLRICRLHQIFTVGTLFSHYSWRSNTHTYALSSTYDPILSDFRRSPATGTSAIAGEQRSRSINPKEAGSFDPISQPGGGGGGRIPPPPSDLGRGATKNSEIRHVRRVSQYERADKIAILKIKAFLNYANLC